MMDRVNFSCVLPPSMTINSGLISLSSKSVSYTHLRAHETKANLVCRLLLEKKKKKQKKYQKKLPQNKL